MPHDGCSDGALLPNRGGEADPRDRVRHGLLLDFYGELLSPRQQECCELYYNDDLSLSEIAETCGISRQGAWDHISRGTKALEEIESKTGLLRRHTETVVRLKHVQELLSEMEAACGENAELSGLLRAVREEVGAMLETED